VSNGFKCGGTVINKNHVVTAGHCIKRRKPSSKTFVIVGHHRVKRTDAFGPDPQQVFGSNMIRVAKFFTRRDYSDGDIAILRLVRDIQFSNRVSPACLPSLPAQSYANMEAVVTGWGGTIGYRPGQSIRNKQSDFLRETSLNVVPPNTDLCKKAIGDQQTYLCAYRLGQDACQGDSGGPITIKQNGRFVLIGVVSGGEGCGARGHAGIYTRVSHFINWIKENAGEVCSPKSQLPEYPTLQTTPSSQIDGECSCSSFINGAGYGQCRKADADFEGSPSCYVNMPTSCTDIIRSGTNPGKFLSAQPCQNKPSVQPPLDLPVQYTTTVPVESSTTVPVEYTTTIPGCSCSQFVNRNGFGKCQKSDSDFGGSVSCYVISPSTCNDLRRSGSNPDKFLSAEACQNKPSVQPPLDLPGQSPTNVPGCSCSQFVNRNGFGKCQKSDSDFGGSVSCYVIWPSTCNDLKRSGSNPDKFLSSEACRFNVAAKSEREKPLDIDRAGTFKKELEDISHKKS